MSMTALMRGVGETLRKNLGLDENGIDYVPQGEPHAMAGKIFYGIYDGPVKYNLIDNALDYTMGVNIAISVRLAHIPRDRKGRWFFLDQTHAIYRLMFQLTGSIQKNYVDILNTANQYIDDGGAGFGPEPLVQAGNSTVMTKSGEWWSAEPEKEAGIAMAVSYFGARRIQYLSDLERTI